MIKDWNLRVSKNGKHWLETLLSFNRFIFKYNKIYAYYDCHNYELYIRYNKQWYKCIKWLEYEEVDQELRTLDYYVLNGELIVDDLIYWVKKSLEI